AERRVGALDGLTGAPRAAATLAQQRKRKQSDKPTMQDFGFYLVMTNPVAGYAECAAAAVRAGVKVVQLRMKHAAREDVLREARKVREITRGTETLFIVNDDPEIAAECGADGVHVGQSDMPVHEVRRLYPSLRVVGLSTHNPDQVVAAAAEKPDYIGVGPVYATPTKDIPDPTLGLATLSRMVSLAPCPAVAIGGIDEKRLPDVIAAGARNWSVVRAVCRDPDPGAAIARLLETEREARRGAASPSGTQA
ncbi:MAG: thiamine phosphate synthase, partial [Kiritimatiellae bacterium]|nr:thiamine phosphate synthase [Kiritimatiellia bacterium]